MLLLAGIDINYLSNMYMDNEYILKTPLMIEALFGNIINVKILLKNKANIHILDETGKTVLDQLIEKKDLKPEIYPKIIKLKKAKEYCKLKRILYKANLYINDDCIRHISFFIN
jgi:hypothetical protein